MAARTNPTATPTSTPTTTRSGILRPERLAEAAHLERVACDPRLDRFVENHWLLRWDLPPGGTYRSQTLPHPACVLTAELGSPRAGVGEDRVVLTGVVTRRFDVDLTGAGRVVGTKFRPGGFAALTGVAARQVTDRTVPVAGVVPHAFDALRSIGLETDDTDAVATVESALVALLPTGPDPSYNVVLAVVADALGDRSIVRVGQLEERHGHSERQLQRLFARYVGATPKWVLARYRMHDVVSALDTGYDGTLADLAAAHGWFDQAHFTRDFQRLVGTTPGAYRARTG